MAPTGQLLSDDRRTGAPTDYGRGSDARTTALESARNGVAQAARDERFRHELAFIFRQVILAQRVTIHAGVDDAKHGLQRPRLARESQAVVAAGKVEARDEQVYPGAATQKAKGVLARLGHHDIEIA